MRQGEWLEYWSGPASVYVSDAHLRAHYRRLFQDVSELLPSHPFTLLDFGCGEALMAPEIAKRGGTVVLHDQAKGRHEILARRYAGHSNVRIAECLDEWGQRCDVALMISVIQYIPSEHLPHVLRQIRQTLRPQGLLVLGDVLVPGNSVLSDVTALLRFGLRERFFGDALRGLVRTLKSDYGRIRKTLGLTSYGLSDLIAILREEGFDAMVHDRNIGHATHRKTILARPRPM